MKAHVVGICGKGTSAVALLLQEKGWEITGSDSGSFEPITSTLISNGIHHIVGYAPENIPQDVSLIILGSSAQLSPETNAEVARAMEMDVPKKSFAEVLQDITKDSTNLVITGSYGKSTCTALTSHILREAGKDPSYFIGAQPKDFETSHLGEGYTFVLEGDEYPHDSTSRDAKFLFYNPSSVLLISAEHDHINKFPTIEDYLKPYQELMKIIPEDGVLVAGINHPYVKEVLKEAKISPATYGFENADYTAQNISYGAVSSFDIFKEDKKIITLETKLIGDHNIENIVGVSALLLENNLVTPEEIQQTIPSFSGVVKRLELKNPGEEIPVYESFGSSYKKATADITAIKKHFPEKNILAVFEPHTFGWRNRGNLDWYDSVFQGVDEVLIYKPPTAGSASHDQLTLDEIYNQVKSTGIKTEKVEEKEMLSKLTKEKVKPDSIVILITSSSFDGEIDNIIQVAN
jgi:UDP-N-acetylmuramate: L-alanyl-gamma-D-glutamyl-meso-diaminopimelate ligase